MQIIPPFRNPARHQSLAPGAHAAHLELQCSKDEVEGRGVKKIDAKIVSQSRHMRGTHVLPRQRPLLEKDAVPVKSVKSVGTLMLIGKPTKVGAN